MEDDDGTTPADLGLRRSSSLEARAVADLSLTVAALATDIGEVARNLDRLTGVERDALLIGLAKRLGDAGDALHEGRRAVGDMAGKTDGG